MRGISSSSIGGGARGDRPAVLEAEAAKFSIGFPGLSVRFAEILGRRLSHLAGTAGAGATGDLRLDISPRLAAFVSGPWQGMEEELRGWSERISEELSARRTDV